LDPTVQPCSPQQRSSPAPGLCCLPCRDSSANPTPPLLCPTPTPSKVVLCKNHLLSSSARKQHCWQAKTIQPLEQLSARLLQRYTQSSQHSLLFIVGPSSARRTTSLPSTTARAHDDTERRIDGRAAPLAHPRVCTLNSQNSSKGVFFTTLVTATVISSRQTNRAVTGDKPHTHAGRRSARRVPAGLRLCRVRPPACTTTRSVVL